MLVFSVLISCILTTTGVSILEPADGGSYAELVSLHAIVENENVLPDSVHYSLNGNAPILIQRLNTDWYTYMKDNNRQGSTGSPAPLTAEVMWTANVTGTSYEYISPIVVDGRLYHASEDQETAFCLNAATGEIIWSFEDIGDSVTDGLVYYEGYVFLAADSLWSLDADTGEPVWSYLGHEDYYMIGSPVVIDDVVYSIETQLYSNNSFVTALNYLDGSLLWEMYLPRKTRSSLTATANRLLVPTYLGPLYALDRNSGEIVWENTDSQGGFWTTSATIVDETIFIGGQDDCLHSINLLTGILNWETDFEANVNSTPCYYDNYLYLGFQGLTGYKKAVCVDAELGTVVWESYGSMYASMGYASGYVYWGDMNNKIIKCSDSSTGDLIWSYEGTECFSSPAIVDGVMFIGATDSNLYAFGTGFKYTYNVDELSANFGDNNLIVTSFFDGIPAAADTVNFTVTSTSTGISRGPSVELSLTVTPNPCISSSTISFELSEQGFVSIDIFDLQGRKVTSLIDSELVTGTHLFNWNGRTRNGEELSSGMYMCRIEVNGIVETIGLCRLK